MNEFDDNNKASHLAVMKRAKIFEGFSSLDCDAIVSLIKPEIKWFAKDEIIINEGDEIDYLGIVCSGKIVRERQDYEGNVSLQHILVSPNIFGFDIASTPTKISPITLKCLKDSKVMLFSYTKLVAENITPAKNRILLMSNLITLLANENMRRLYKIELLSQKLLRKRIVMYLNFVARKTGSRTFIIPFDRSQFAQYLNANRSALSSELSQMKKDGLIAFNKNKFTINDDL